MTRILKTTVICITVLIAAFLGACGNPYVPDPPIAPQTIWIAANDFGNTNPHNSWSFGILLSALTDSFAPFSVYEGGMGWTNGNNDGQIWKNSTGSTSFDILPQQLSMHPGANHEMTVLRWTAPAAGDYSMHAQFLIAGPGVTEAWVRHNTTYLMGTSGSGMLTDANPSCNAYLSLAEGDVLDFIIGDYGDWGADNTPVIAVISRFDSATP